MILLKEGDVIHKSGCIELLKIIDRQLAHAASYEVAALKAERQQITQWIDELGSDETMIYKKRQG